MNTVAVFLATGCYAGYAPKAPGTVGSLVGVALAYVLTFLSWPVYAIVAIFGVATAIYVSGAAEKRFGHDGRQIVIDEIIGMVVTMAFLPSSWLSFLLGFVFFRAMDIIKIFPANWAQKLPGGIGVVADDLVAALYAHFLVRFTLMLLIGPVSET
ncbi:MAG: phosphatidylglycerophosphatase A [candidate division Zixibacteria bacterium]|nr:phosphatidylglycerophosphatase A [candidate division Zixibacteria bacterium]